MAKRRRRKKLDYTKKLAYPVSEDTSVNAGVNSAGNPTIGANTSQGDVNVGGSVDTAGNAVIGANTTQDGVTVGAGVNTSGNANVGISTGVGDGGHVGVGYDTSGNVGANAGYDSGTVDANLGVGYNTNTGATGVTPTLTVGEGTGATVGGAVGGYAGAAVGGAYGGPWGAAAGSVFGSLAGSAVGSQFDGGKDEKQDKARDAVLNAYKDAGLLESDYSYTMPDGSKFNFAADSEDRDWKNKDKRVVTNNPGKTTVKHPIGDRDITLTIKPKYQGADKLHNYDVDYTNDMDYIAGMAGITLSRIYAGDKKKYIDQVGNMMGNAALGKVGYGAEFNRENFNKVMTNTRSMYAKAGITSKEEMLGLANKMYADKRISDTDYAVMNQTANLVFNNDFNQATQLMTGRWEGIKTLASDKDKASSKSSAKGSEDSNVKPANPRGEAAAETDTTDSASAEEGDGATPTPDEVPAETAPPAGPTQNPGNYPGHIASPVLSPEEAFLSVQPYIDYAKANIKNPVNSVPEWQQTLSGITGLISAFSGLFGGSSKPGEQGQQQSGLTGIIKDLWNYLVGPNVDANSPDQAQVGNANEGVGGTDVNLEPSDVGGYDSGFTSEDGGEVFTGGEGYNSGYTDAGDGSEVFTGDTVTTDGSYDAGYTSDTGESVFY